MGIENYAAAFFRNGGVPPLSLEGNFQTGEAVQRASEDITRALKKINAEKGSILPIPVNHKLVKLGSDPEKGQMVDAQRFIIEQIARGFNLPPVFLQDLTHGTFSNNEQQDLHLTKHTLSGMIKKIEAELNLKLFGRSNTKKFVQFNLDALMRGEFAARMGGYQTAINSGVMTPAEARQIEDLPFKPGSDRLFIQGANVPIDGGSEKKGSSDE
jgi:HK97 family phage portal protein